MANENNGTGAAVGIYFIVMGIICMAACMIANLFFDISYSTPIILLLIGSGLLIIFGGINRQFIKRKDPKNIDINKGVQKTDEDIRTKVSDVETAKMQEEVMQIFKDDKET